MKGFLLISLFFSNVICAQNDYITYHQQCRKAEKFFIQQQPDSAIALFQLTFQSYPYLFPRDCYMAAQIAQHHNKDSAAVAFLISAFEFGLRIETIEQDTSSRLHHLIATPYWKQAQAIFPEKYNRYLAAIDQPLKKTIDQFITEDQKARMRNNKWFNRNFRPKLEKTFDRMNDQHIRFIDSVCKVKGYPGSWLIGIGDSLFQQANNATQLNSNLNEATAILAYHNDSIHITLGDFLFSEIAKGHIHPRTYAMIRDFQNRHLIKKDQDEKMFYNIWWERDNFSEAEFIAHCDAIGCPTKKHQKQLYEALGKGYDSFGSPFR